MCFSIFALLPQMFPKIFRLMPNKLQVSANFSPLHKTALTRNETQTKLRSWAPWGLHISPEDFALRSYNAFTFTNRPLNALFKFYMLQFRLRPWELTVGGLESRIRNRRPRGQKCTSAETSSTARKQKIQANAIETLEVLVASASRNLGLYGQTTSHPGGTRGVTQGRRHPRFGPVWLWLRKRP